MAISNRDQLIGAIDQLDVGIGLLRAAFLASINENGLLADDIEAISTALNQAERHLIPGRKVINQVVKDMPFEAMP